MIKIGGVPEHFNFPLKQAIEKHENISWVDCPGGSGEMKEKLDNKSLNAAIILTEGAVNAFQSNNDLYIVGEYVSSPLRWGIFSHPDNEDAYELNSQEELLVSRLGSGSHLIPFAQAFFSDKSYSPNIKVIKNLDGALEHFNTHKKGLFYWEEVTTSPWVKSGQLKQIGVYPTPWPCFVMLANNLETKKELTRVLEEAKKISDELKSTPEKSITEISKVYGIEQEKVRFWFNRVEWQQNKLSQKQLDGIGEVLKEQKLISGSYKRLII